MRALRLLPRLTMLTLGLACTPADDGTAPVGGPADPASASSPVRNPIVELLDEGQSVFGVFSGPKTAEQGALMAEVADADLVFYSLEDGPFDLDTMQAYMDALRVGAADPASARPLVLRVPPVSAGEDTLVERVSAALDAGVHGVVFPHVRNSRDAEVAVAAMRFAGSTGEPSGTRPSSVGRAPRVWGVAEGEYRRGADVWPLASEGQLVAMLIVEDREGVEHASEIAATPGVGVLFAGPGDLRRAFEGDMEQVERAIQTVLAACKRHSVPCGITAGPEDVANRLGQGFRLIIVQQLEALAVGRAAAGRDD